MTSPTRPCDTSIVISKILSDFGPLIVTGGLLTVFLGGLHFWLLRNKPANADAHLPRQLAVILSWVFGLLLVLLALPVSETTRGQLLSLTGLILTALIALSSTTLVANAMAGLLLRIVNSFRPGDFIRVGEQFGRVSDRGLFHTEIQTEDRDLTTLPNMHLINNPVTVVHNSGTIISATLSLGYDLHHSTVEKHLKEAARQSGLQDPFVQILELGDFSVVYRIGGHLLDVSSLITARSHLRAHVLDTLHAADIEIVSPAFMNQRPQEKSQRAIPPVSSNDAYRSARSTTDDELKVENIVFDKAELASQDQQRRQRVDEINKHIKELPADSSERTALEAERTRLIEEGKAAEENTQPSAEG